MCREEMALPCKGYGECIMWSWVSDNKRDCLDGSDLGKKLNFSVLKIFLIADFEYMRLMQSQYQFILPPSSVEKSG